MSKEITKALSWMIVGMLLLQGVTVLKESTWYRRTFLQPQSIDTPEATPGPAMNHEVFSE